MVDAASIHSVRGASLVLPRRLYVLRRDAALVGGHLTLYFFPGLPADDSDAAAGAREPVPAPMASHIARYSGETAIDTPIGAIHRHWFSSGPVSLTFLGAVLLLCCSWSLEGE